MQQSAHEEEKKKTVDACGVATMNPDPPPGQVQKGLNLSPSVREGSNDPGTLYAINREWLGIVFD